MKDYTDDDLLNLRLKYKDDHVILELIDTVEELLEPGDVMDYYDEDEDVDNED